MPFPFYEQPDQMDCGPTCLRMIAKHYGRNFRAQTLRQLCEINKEGVSLLGISDAAEKIGFRTLGVKLNSAQLKEAELPCILHWRQHHFVVLYKIKGNKYYMADPAAGLVMLEEADFNRNWHSDKDNTKVLHCFYLLRRNFMSRKTKEARKYVGRFCFAI